ncbi:DUF5329 domain-containing protein [Eleftheria terrae]|uniref:DUF5329 domain-containing protein n=1 Tax=Eleftheria terrae TaxID=1597781 RepID=UPI00263BC859|nr:DUF5329 domain-containing protein [Eleftheria terrae]WKB53611.1 DUF5329 domain-containing protein [Eleftheria terrae]
MRYLTSWALALALAAPLAASADEPSAAVAAEVAGLLSHLGQSGCRFNRNGSWYSAAEAQEHLQKKYRYLQDRKLVSSTESFIERAASRSSASGQPYLVQCGNAPPQESAAWLGQALNRRRSNAARP